MNYQRSYVDIPPWLPIPGTSIVYEGGRDAVPFPLPSYMGHSFTALCSLAPIINDILIQHYDSGDRVPPVTSATSFEFAERIYDVLMAWAQSLPVAMSPLGDIPHHVAVIQ